MTLCQTQLQCHHSFLLHAIHLYHTRLWQSYTTDVFRFMFCRQRIQIAAVENFEFTLCILLVRVYGIRLAVVIHVDGEISHSERCEVLEEMRTL